MNEETNQALEKFADKIIQKVTQDFSEKLEVVRSELIDKFENKIEGVKTELADRIEETSEKLNKKMDTGFEMLHAQIDSVEGHLTARVQGIENRMENEAENRVIHYATKTEYKKLDERVGIIEGTLKPA